MTASWTETRNCLLESQEAERQRLAQVLHDGPLQELHSLDFGLVALARHLEDQVARDQWNAMRVTLHAVSRQLRNLCQDLRPPALGPFGLTAVLQSYAESFQRRHPTIQLDLDLAEDGQRLPQPVRLACYRICQQGLRNIAQHATATRVQISLRLGADEVVLTIEDNGAGFVAPDTWPATWPESTIEWANDGRFGLFECGQRAAAIDGQLTVEARPGHGVRLQLTAPIHTA